MSTNYKLPSLRTNAMSVKLSRFYMCMIFISSSTEQGSKEKQGEIEEKIFKDEELVNLIDPILNVDDTNRDGFIDYPEFIKAQQKAAGQKQDKPQH